MLGIKVFLKSLTEAKIFLGLSLPPDYVHRKWQGPRAFPIGHTGTFPRISQGCVEPSLCPYKTQMPFLGPQWALSTSPKAHRAQCIIQACHVPQSLNQFLRPSRLLLRPKELPRGPTEAYGLPKDVTEPKELPRGPTEAQAFLWVPFVLLPGVH